MSKICRRPWLVKRLNSAMDIPPENVLWPPSSVVLISVLYPFLLNPLFVLKLEVSRTFYIILFPVHQLTIFCQPPRDLDFPSKILANEKLPCGVSFPAKFQPMRSCQVAGHFLSYDYL